MVAMKEAERDVLRFISVDDLFKDAPVLRTYQFICMVFGLSSSPLSLMLQFGSSRKELGRIVTKLLLLTYVNHIISGINLEDEMQDVFMQSKRIFQEKGLNLLKFRTNFK